MKRYGISRNFFQQSMIRQNGLQEGSSNPIVSFGTGKVISDSDTCLKFYASGWKTFTNNMELLPEDYTSRFSDGISDAVNTIVAEIDNHIY